MSTATILIIKTGSATPLARERYGDFDRWFMRVLGPLGFDDRIVSPAAGEPLPEGDALDRFAGVIVTGSAAMVSHRLDWSEHTARWLATVAATDRLPILGVCYGHQLIAHALGGRVGPNPNGLKMGTVVLEDLVQDDALMSVVDAGSKVQITHFESVLEMPPAARRLARTTGDPNHALHFGGRCWGVQFHPEFDAAIMRTYIEARAKKLESEGLDSQKLLAEVSETPAGPALLRRFAELCQQTARAGLPGPRQEFRSGPSG